MPRTSRVHLSDEEIERMLEEDRRLIEAYQAAAAADEAARAEYAARVGRARRWVLRAVVHILRLRPPPSP